MTRERGSQNPEPPGAQLARLLRRWWEGAERAADGKRPTQQALAARLGVDQTTLSRYLNPKHASTAPPRIVDALHAHLRAPAAELPRARALSRAAMEQNARGRHTEGDDPAAPAHPAPHGGLAALRTRPRGAFAVRGVLALLALVLTAALSFAAGLYVHQRFASPGQSTGRTMAGAAAGQEAEKWPLLYLKKGIADEYARGRALQNLLNAHGHGLRADGLFDEETHEAVMDFQQKHHLQTDGKVGRRTWPELIKHVEPGSKGPAVRAVQDLLNNIGLGATEVSGRFTAATAADLKFFQRTHHLAETGRADRATWLALLINQRPPMAAPDYQRPEAMSPTPPA